MTKFIKQEAIFVKPHFATPITSPSFGGSPCEPKVIITCAVTGAGDTVGKSPQRSRHARADRQCFALEAASAGATVVHCHVRNPETGKGSRRVDYYREVMERIRAKNTDVIINLTAGMGGDVVVGDGENAAGQFGDGTDCVGPLERLIHVKELQAPKSARWTAAR